MILGGCPCRGAGRPDAGIGIPLDDPGGSRHTAAHRLRRAVSHNDLIPPTPASGTITVTTPQSTTKSVMASVTESVTQAHALGRVAVRITRHELQTAAALSIPYEGTNAATGADFPAGFVPSFGSGLAFKGRLPDGTLEFYAITDRGPNGDGPTVPVPGAASGETGISKVFPAPGFTPSIGIIRVGTGAVLDTARPLRHNATRSVSGLPPGSGSGATGETPLTDAYTFDPARAGHDANGLDTESLVFDRARQVLWASDEYGPFILRIDITTGVIERKYGPGTGAGDLPAVLAQRRVNRGMEGLALDVASACLHGFLQSPLDPKDAHGDSIRACPPGGGETPVRDSATFVRWLAFDPATETSRLYAYPLDGAQYERGRTGNAKLGDVASLGQNKFVVIEQGARRGDGRVMNKLMLVEIPADATDIAALDHRLEISSITRAASDGVDWSGVVPLRKTELLDLNAAGWVAEKAEGLTLVDEHTLALINDNDFGLRTVLLDGEGAPLAGSIEGCTVDASGSIVSGGPPGVAGARITRATDHERPMRLWLLRFEQRLVDLVVPAP